MYYTHTQAFSISHPSHLAVLFVGNKGNQGHGMGKPVVIIAAKQRVTHDLHPFAPPKIY